MQDKFSSAQFRNSSQDGVAVGCKINFRISSSETRCKVGLPSIGMVFLHACTCLLYCVINFCDVNVFTHVFCVTSSFFGRVVGVFIGLYFYRIDHSCFGGHEGLFSQVSVYIMAFVVNSNFFHIFLTSDGCLNRFHKNRPNDFWIGLQNEKVLGNSRRWSVGIQNIHFDSDLYNCIIWVLDQVFHLCLCMRVNITLFTQNLSLCHHL